VDRRILLATPTAALAALLMPATAPALIQVDTGIAGARLGNTSAQVHAALGAPSRTHTGKNEFGAFRQETYQGGIVVSYQGGRTVTSVETTGLGDRTAKAVGVGSTEKAVRAKIPGVKCETSDGIRLCHTHDFVPGRHITDFFIKAGKVTRVSVDVVID
jgi:hypothetical protein